MNSLVRTHALALALGAALVVGIASPGCQPAGMGSPGSCTRTDTRCIELGQGHLETAYPMNCVYPSVYSPSPCPSANHVGRCVESTTISGMVSVVTTHYYLPETTAQAESNCLAAGATIWTTRTVRFTAE